jgi:hypothetical protein
MVTQKTKKNEQLKSSAQTVGSAYKVDKIAFEGPKTPDRGYTVRASYLKKPHSGDALIEIFKDGILIRNFLFPSYKVWNIAAHFQDIVDGEIENSVKGYEMAAWDGISNAVIILPEQKE